MQRSSVAAQLRLPQDPRLQRVLLAYGLSRFTEFAGWLAVLFVAYAAIVERGFLRRHGRGLMGLAVLKNHSL